VAGLHGHSTNVSCSLRCPKKLVRKHMLMNPMATRTNSERHLFLPIFLSWAQTGFRYLSSLAIRIDETNLTTITGSIRLHSLQGRERPYRIRRRCAVHIGLSCSGCFGALRWQIGRQIRATPGLSRLLRHLCRELPYEDL
jgi:hypothetical protein